MSKEYIQEKFNTMVAEQVAKATDEGFINGVKWLKDFIILEMEYQGLHQIAQKLTVFINNKEQEIN